MAEDVIVGLGARSEYVARVPNIDVARLGLIPDEAMVLACVGRASSIQEVIGRCGLVEPKAIATLLSLRAKGAIAPARVQQPPANPASLSAASSEQIDLEPERKKEILELERTIDQKNHFELLGIAPGADALEVRRAYHDFSKKFHPDRFYNRNLGSFRSRIEQIYRKVSEANAVLSDERRRQMYLRDHPELLVAKPVAAPPPEELSSEGQARAAERRSRMAHHPYLAKARRGNELLAEGKKALEKGEYAEAYGRLNLAAQAEPTNREIQALLAQARRSADNQRTEREMERARTAEASGDLDAAIGAYRTLSNSNPMNATAAAKAAQLLLRQGNAGAKDAKLFAQRAVDAEPRNGDYRVMLAQVMYELGMKKLAKRELEEALKVSPDHAGAKGQLRKLRWTF